MEKKSIKTKNEIEFSVIIGCYYEENSIAKFHQRLSDTLNSLNRSYEIIFVNDGSTDKTFEKLTAIFQKDPNVSAVIDLFKNTGQAGAYTAGIVRAKGRAMIFMDSDLQLDPEELPLLIRKYDEGYDIVTGYRKNRKDSLFRKLPSKIANMIMRKASNTNLRDFGCTFKIYDAKLIRAFDFNSFKQWRSVAVISMAGRIAEVAVSHHPRRYGNSGWTFKKLFAYNMDNFVNLSQKPFQVVGVICFLLAILFTFRLGLEYFISISILPRITNGLILNVLVVNLLSILAVLSATGEFAIRNFLMLQKKPVFIIREIHERRLFEENSQDDAQDDK